MSSVGMIVTVICFLATSVLAQAVNPTPSGDETPGQMPYEMRWADRTPPAAQVWFDDLTGWTIRRTQGDADVGLHASIAQRIWRNQTAKFTYHHGTQRTTAVIRPAKPIAIDGIFDAARMWVFGGWYRRATDDAKAPEITLLLQDRKGVEVRIGLGAITSGNWSIEQGVVPPEAMDASNFPMSFTGMEIDQVDFPNGQSDMHFESIEFYQQHRNPVVHRFEQRNKIFPTSDDGYLPTPPAGDVKITVKKNGKGAILTSEVGGKTLEFRTNPDGGFLSGIEARWNGGEWFKPADGGSFKGIDVSKAKIKSTRIENDALIVVWTDGEGGKRMEWQAAYSLKGRTLVIDVSSSGGSIAGIDAGEVSGLRGARGVFVPYLALNRITHLTTEGPLIACGDEAFVSVIPDVYNSDFSNLVNDPSKDWQPSDGKLRLLTGTEYHTLTDGKRNDLRDRFLISVSDEFADVLPNARNPVSIHRNKLAPYVHFMAYVTHEEMFRATHRYGMDKLVANHHVFAHFVGDGYQRLASFAYRWRPREDTVIQQWMDYAKFIKGLGYLYGVYTYFPDLSPLSEYWDENKIALDQDGGLRRGWWYGYFFIKLNDAARMGGEVAELIKQIHDPDATYLDIHTVIGPHATDYEAGVDNAGTARGTVLANGDVIAETRKRIDGPVFGEGYHRWLYAGLGDADYATLLHPSRYGSASGTPLLIDFDRLKIAPFAHGTMMGFEPKYFLGETSSDTEAVYKNDTAIAPPIGWYKYLAASLAYGHMGALGYDYLPNLNRMIHLYALMQGVQSEYLSDNTVSIEYHDGENFIGTSDALRKDVVKNGRLRVNYSRGLLVIVNYNEQPWTLDAAGRSFELPPYGWVIEKPGEILAYSALRDGQRVDVVKCPNYIYVNTGGQAFKDDELGIELAGALWLKRQDDGAWLAIPCGDLGPWEKFYPEKWPDDLYDFRLTQIPANRGLSNCLIDTTKLLGKSASQLSITARDADGKDVRNAEVKIENDQLRITTRWDVVDYILK